MRLSQHTQKIRKQRGVVLVIVLSVIVMLAILIVTMLTMARNEIKTTNQYVNSSDARLGATAALRIVQGQIREATITGLVDVAGGGQPKRHAWASQPGAIRVWDDRGQLTNIYKLYSSENMISSDPASIVGDLPPNWKDTPNDFVDLNEPVYRNEEWVYPIANPKSLVKTNTAYYVEGFFSSRASTAVGDEEPDDSLAMPTRWLYVNKNGLIENTATPDSVMRVAFWTDDESCKINVNTASGTDDNSYTDIPRANTKTERTVLAMMQPAQNEFNRYPGHPATISLYTVFPGIASSGTKTPIQRLIEASPRYKWGGSENGKKDIWSRGNALSNGQPKKDRFYATMDEYFFTGSSPAAEREPQLGLTAGALEARRFFLTANSRSSDLNLFGQPRVAIWPISSKINSSGNKDQYCTPFDLLIAHCATLKVGSGSGSGSGKQYFFVRKDAYSQTADWTDSSCVRNQGVFKYLQSLTSKPFPGFATNGNTFETKYNTKGERDQILAEIFDYIRCVNLNETYNLGANSTSTTGKTVDSYTTRVPSGTYINQGNTVFGGAGIVLPIDFSIDGNDVRGAGRVPMISEMGIWMIQMYGDKYAKVQTTGNPPVPKPDPKRPGRYLYDWYIDWAKAPTIPEYQSGFLTETFSPMQGFMPWMTKNFVLNIRGNNPPTVFLGQPDPLADPPPAKDPITGLILDRYQYLVPLGASGTGATLNSGVVPAKGNMIGGIDGFVWPLGTAPQSYSALPLWTKKATFASGSDPANANPTTKIAKEENYSAIQLRKWKDSGTLNGSHLSWEPTYSNTASFSIRAGSLVIGLQMAGIEYQTYNIDIPELPSEPLPPPIDIETYKKAQRNPLYPLQVTNDRQGFSFRKGAGGVAFDEETGGLETDVRPITEDYVRTVTVHDGDFRVVAYLKDVPKQFFQDPETAWKGNNAKTVNLRGGLNGAYYYTKNASYVPNVPSSQFEAWRGPEGADDTLWRSALPKYPHYDRTGNNPLGDLLSNKWDGDFDNGVGNQVDGPYLNKSDEGGMSVPNSPSGVVNSVGTPYFYWRWGPGESVFSPLKQLPSAVMFGSLPTGVKQTLTAYKAGNWKGGAPWRTLNFCPNPLSKDDHFDLKSQNQPRDFLFLDLFTMPVVEPYPISEPFSTAGRLNMNYQMVPFTYIKRQTALYALFRANKMMAIGNNLADTYKTYSSAGGQNDDQIRFKIDPVETLKQFETRFDSNDIFRSAAEICTIFLVPEGKGATASSIKNWWDDYQLTGNNSREKPYAVMYPLLTTKSNVYTTYVRAQAIKVTPDGEVVPQSEYRGSATFERYLDSQNSEISASNKVDPDVDSLEPYYRFRTLSTKQFDP